MKVSYTTATNIDNPIKELCKRVMKSNLSDDDKIEIITKLNQSNLTPSYPITYIGGTLPNDPICQAHKRKGVEGTTGEGCIDINMPHIYSCNCKEK